ncbi:MAG TPA: PD-(D/E)XK nuclease-like domain-containing protein [Candidatus Fermentibacter daniensis]|nr:PD-(D/E)XK nuclease-like domain-containing protein [Sedimentisphaerales bacterium]HOR08361.1 PD-(D/E)XK nuclease-like domain-containing protein [Candidatus Fermentibacter daniensis]
MTQNAPRIRPGVSPTTREEYEAYPAVHYSTLKYMMQSPLHYRYAETHPAAETPAMLLGRATHTAVFEPDRLPLEYVVWPHRRQGRDWDEFKAAAESAGKTVLNGDEYQTALDIRDSVRGQSVAAAMLHRGRPEVMLAWQNQETGLDVKGRLDWIASLADGSGAIIDLKTTADISPRIFAAHAWRLGYYHQAAMYQEGYAATSGGTVLPCYIIAVESKPPHACTVYSLPAESVAAAWDQYVGWLRAVLECRASGVWPGPVEEAELPAPSWAVSDAEVDFGGIGE